VGPQFRHICGHISSKFRCTFVEAVRDLKAPLNPPLRLAGDGLYTLEAADGAHHSRLWRGSNEVCDPAAGDGLLCRSLDAAALDADDGSAHNEKAVQRRVAELWAGDEYGAVSAATPVSAPAVSAAAAVSATAAVLSTTPAAVSVSAAAGPGWVQLPDAGH
jgi:hypothetical protein